ncbi:polymorphic toxin type 44 domain-containing protein [Christensenella tenuis]
MVYIQEELARRKKEREKEEKIGYNGGKENEASLDKLFEAWDRQYAGERSGVLPGRTGKQFTRGQIGENAEKYGTAGALFEAKERFGEGASPETIRATLTSHPEVTLPKGQNAERLRMFQTAGKRDRAAEREPQEDGGQKLFFPGGREEMLEYLREHPDAALPNGMTITQLDEFQSQYLDNGATQTLIKSDGNSQDFPDYTNALTEYLEGVVDECRSSKQKQGLGALPEWINKVRPEGKWDPKSNKKEIAKILGYEDSSGVPDTFYFNGKLMNWEEFGNLMYGVSGSAIGFSPTALNVGSEVVQFGIDTVRNVTNPTTREKYWERLRKQKENEAKDQSVIQRGIDYYDQHFKE